MGKSVAVPLVPGQGGVWALAGGRVRIPDVTDHVEASLALLDAFGVETAVENRETSAVVSVEPRF